MTPVRRGSDGEPPIRLGIAGLGLAGAFMIRAAAVHPHISLIAAMDPLPRPREAFARDFGATAYAQYDALCSDPDVEAIYIASPHRFHARQAVMAMDRGKHVLVEKPMALSLADCDAVIEAADRTGLHAIVGHTHAFDANIRAMRKLIESGELGKLAMILAFNYNDFLLRPHRHDEFDSDRSGGIVFNQVAHQIEMVRLLAGRPLRSVRANVGSLEQARPAAGHCTAFLAVDGGAAASVTFSAYDFFDSDEFHHWIAEGGVGKESDRHGKTRRAFLARQTDAGEHADLGYGVRALATAQPFLPHFGLVIATCERGDLRLSPNGITIHGVDGTREVPVERGPGRPGQGDALDALWAALRHGRRSIHDARWGKATVEVVLAILRSSEESREVELLFQDDARQNDARQNDARQDDARQDDARQGDPLTGRRTRP
jgi:phthalate 4,5-cis-dihydrodiol dehydrogenase